VKRLRLTAVKLSINEKGRIKNYLNTPPAI